VNEAMAEATQMGGTDAEMYANLAKGLASRGLTQDAMAATEKARAAKRDEQAMTLAASQEARAVSGEKRAVSAEERNVEEAAQRKTKFEQETKLYPLTLKKAGLEVLSLEEAMRGDVGNKNYYQQAITTGVDPITKAPLTVDQIAVAKGKIVDINTKLSNVQAELDMKRQHYAAQENHWKALQAQGASQIQLARERMNQENFSQPAFIQVPSEFPGQAPQKIYVGSKNKAGKVRGKDGQFYDNENEAAEAQKLSPTSTPPANPPAETQTDNKTNKANKKPPQNTAPGWSSDYIQ
jgi:hypothetical protein